ncbi:hypothetical protein [uncultured Roseobacter sp.]|uniref:hypothetical protein n=1 Tax=uncultured Roseobacter sp. TaxID=114847 RepID=UPI002625828A|nr:hypothetical protein [uncultured Roseobacter sp.]
MPMRALVLGCILTVLAMPVTARFYLTINRLEVNEMSANTFEVIESRGAGARDIWCAAADYTQRTGRDGPRKRLYILTPRGPSQTVPGETGVGFTLAPDDALKNTPPSYSVSVRRKGENLPVHHAHQFCDVAVDDFLDRF